MGPTVFSLRVSLLLLIASGSGILFERGRGGAGISTGRHGCPVPCRARACGPHPRCRASSGAYRAFLAGVKHFTRGCRRCHCDNDILRPTLRPGGRARRYLQQICPGHRMMCARRKAPPGIDPPSGVTAARGRRLLPAPAGKLIAASCIHFAPPRALHRRLNRARSRRRAQMPRAGRERALGSARPRPAPRKEMPSWAVLGGRGRGVGDARGGQRFRRRTRGDDRRELREERPTPPPSPQAHRRQRGSGAATRPSPIPAARHLASPTHRLPSGFQQADHERRSPRAAARSPAPRRFY
jgi:hypothetical protein